MPLPPLMLALIQRQINLVIKQMNKHFVLTLALSIIMTLALSACSPRLHHFDQAEFVLKDSRASREYLNKDSMEKMDMHAFYAYGVSASTAEGTDY